MRLLRRAASALATVVLWYVLLQALLRLPGMPVVAAWLVDTGSWRWLRHAVAGLRAALGASGSESNDVLWLALNALAALAMSLILLRAARVLLGRASLSSRRLTGTARH